jgi:hypothetical protein
VKAQPALPMPNTAWVLFWATLCISAIAVRRRVALCANCPFVFQNECQ